MPKTDKNLETTLEKLKTAQAKVTLLEEKVAAERKDTLSNLHTTVGFNSREDLIEALQGLGGGRRGRPKGSSKAVPKVRGKRTKITAEMRTAIVKALKSGQKGVAVAAEFGISNPSLHNIKKAAGLVKGRKK